MNKCTEINLSGPLFCFSQFSLNGHNRDVNENFDSVVSYNNGTLDSNDLKNLDYPTDGNSEGERSFQDIQ